MEAHSQCHERKKEIAPGSGTPIFAIRPDPRFLTYVLCICVIIRISVMIVAKSIEKAAGTSFETDTTNAQVGDTSFIHVRQCVCSCEACCGDTQDGTAATVA